MPEKMQLHDAAERPLTTVTLPPGARSRLDAGKTVALTWVDASSVRTLDVCLTGCQGEIFLMTEDAEGALAYARSFNSIGRDAR